MAKFYKHPDEQSCLRNRVDYDVSQKIESRAKGDFITMHWADPVNDKNGVWYVQKPDHLECSIIARCHPEAIIVDGADIDWPDPAEP